MDGVADDGLRAAAASVVARIRLRQVRDWSGAGATGDGDGGGARAWRRGHLERPLSEGMAARAQQQRAG
uniref:Uncharacterized protein n=1 Tax=Oryza nivara TaxID=4536 RepID=A0A0E0IW07_ORYNI